MILGIGCDILDIKRFQKAANTALIERVFSPKECAEAKKQTDKKKWGYLAKRFAAKEAFSKACGTGIGQYIGWKDVEVLNDSFGAPILSLSPKARTFIQKKFKCQKFKAHITLSDDVQALAFVVLEK